MCLEPATSGKVRHLLTASKCAADSRSRATTIHNTLSTSRCSVLFDVGVKKPRLSFCGAETQSSGSEKKFAKQTQTHANRNADGCSLVDINGRDAAVNGRPRRTNA